ncbi:ATPdependent RNA helicase [Chytridiales sp. JEL 0842]|nr:ATPdependent RNA helicase [Chytridiales sp. JEL 0842]
MPPPKKGSSSSAPSKDASADSGSKKGGKKGSDKKSGKDSTPAAPVLFVPEPGVKLTKEQHAILRAQRAQAAAEEKRLLFGSWTGAVPLTVLYEQAKKNEWDKPQVNITKKGNGYVGNVVISTVDKKSKERKRVTFGDPTKTYPTEAEAKQWAATYALHRFSSHLSIHRVLPPSHQSYWNTLETIRKASDPEVQLYDYAADPFGVEEAKMKAQKEKEKQEKEERERLEREEEKKKGVWEEMEEVHLSGDVRNMLEGLLRSVESGDSKESGASSSKEGTGSSMDKKSIIKSLVEKGFRQAHAEEAIEYCNDLTSALDWLCVYVPEDDLPPTFISKHHRDIATGSSTTEALTREWAVKRMVASGFNPKTCEDAYTSQGNSELRGLAYLVTQLAGIPKDEDPPRTPAEQVQQAWDEELEALESIFASSFSKPKSQPAGTISIRLQTKTSDAYLVVGLPEGSQYPSELPAFWVACEGLPAYIRLGILKSLARVAKGWVGGPMVFEMVNYLEEHFEGLVEKPGKLMELALGGGGGGDAATQGASMTVEESMRGSALEAGKKNTGAKSSKGKKGSKYSHVSDDPALGAKLKEEFIAQTNSSDYQRMLQGRQKLPSFNFREKIISAVSNHQVLIICGETGCGKSTQTGQFLLESELSSGRGGKCNMICTQPRRISATSLAERVAAERAQDIGGLVGYAIRGETVRSDHTRLTFCTTGILLRMLQGDPLLQGISHVIVDEVHERSLDSDFLLVILKDLLPRRPDFRLILMSATIDSSTFASYFSNAPVLDIPGFTHPVTDFYLEDILQKTQYIPEPRPRGRSGLKPLTNTTEEDTQTERMEDEEKVGGEKWRQQYESLQLDPRALQWLMRESPQDPIDYSLIAATVKYICQTETDEGAVLIFMPGAMEINKCIDVIKWESGEKNLELLPLHANLSNREQSAVFKRPRRGFRKVIVSTNVAETSITIDDCVFVIDCGRVKEMRFEHSTLCLMETLASRASCKQRRGRAGRVRPGKCFKLFSRRFEKEKMPAHSVPEMLRVPLEQLCLSLKSMGIVDVQSFLGKAIDPPPAIHINNALNTLKVLKAVDEDSRELTPLGSHMASIPADLRIAKMLIFASIFHCLDPVLTIAAIMSSKSFFVAPFEKREEAKAARDKFAWDKSDWLTDSRAFDAWVEAARGGKAQERQFCEQNFMSMPALVAVSDLRKQYKDILRDIGFVNSQNESLLNSNSHQSRIIKAALMSGLYPQIVTVQHPRVKYHDTAKGAMVKEAKAQQIQFHTKEDGKVALHPASVNFSVTKWPVLLLGGSLSVDHEGKTVEVDGFTKFKAFPRISVLVNGLRKLIDEALKLKIEDPSLDIANTPVGKAALRLIISEGE